MSESCTRAPAFPFNHVAANSVSEYFFSFYSSLLLVSAVSCQHITTTIYRLLRVFDQYTCRLSRRSVPSVYCITCYKLEIKIELRARVCVPDATRYSYFIRTFTSFAHREKYATRVCSVFSFDCVLCRRSDEFNVTQTCCSYKCPCVCVS